MFDSQRYISKGINSTIPLVLQIVMWDKIDNMKIEKDYLQVFKLTPKTNNTVHIEHFQEEPDFKEEFDCKVKGENMIHESYKIYVIDSETYSTMILSSEY